MTNGKLVRLENWCHLMTAKEYAETARISVTVSLVICDDEHPPEYQTSGVFKLCTLHVDLTPLKPFEAKTGKIGVYYESNFQIVVNFGPEITYGVVSGNRILGSISANYYR